jgi:hypothetical protein
MHKVLGSIISIGRKEGRKEGKKERRKEGAHCTGMNVEILILWGHHGKQTGEE